jgi:large subunit ribosomal protein L29
MKMLDTNEIRSLSDESVQKEIIAIRRILFDFRLKQATKQVIKPNILKAYKNQLARIMTIKDERLLINKQ